MEIVTLGLDLGKNWVHMMERGRLLCAVVSDAAGLRR